MAAGGPAAQPKIFIPLTSRVVDRCPPILRLKIDVTTRSNELLRDGSMPIDGRDVERCVPMRFLVVDEGLRALRRQQRANLCCVTITRGLAKLLPRTH